MSCSNVHCWTWAGSGSIPGDTPCDCGARLYRYAARDPQRQAEEIDRLRARIEKLELVKAAAKYVRSYLDACLNDQPSGEYAAPGEGAANRMYMKLDAALAALREE